MDDKTDKGPWLSCEAESPKKDEDEGLPSERTMMAAIGIRSVRMVLSHHGMLTPRIDAAIRKMFTNVINGHLDEHLGKQLAELKDELRKAAQRKN